MNELSSRISGAKYTEDNIDLKKLEEALSTNCKMDLINANARLKAMIVSILIKDRVQNACAEGITDSVFLYVFEGNKGLSYTTRKNGKADCQTFLESTFPKIELSDFIRSSKKLFNDIWD